MFGFTDSGDLWIRFAPVTWEGRWLWDWSASYGS